ncbi:MAG TPA: c-type cytochrome [Caulobacteraceae bacterium]|jgi:cytochrome c
MAITRGWTVALAAASTALAAVVAIAQPAGVPARGADVFDDRCSECHALTGVHQGPSLVGVVGRRAGAEAGYAYTPAMKAAGVTWTAAELDRFLQGPKKLIPGTAMAVIISDPTERRDLIAYLGTLKAH